MAYTNIINQKLKKEIEGKVRKELLDHTAIELSYNSFSINGGKISKSNFISIYDKCRREDLIDPQCKEGYNDIKSFIKLTEYMVKVHDHPLNIPILKTFHRMLDGGKYRWDKKSSGRGYTNKELTDEKVFKMYIEMYNTSGKKKQLHEILTFYVDYITIKPFDNTPIVSNFILFKECLNNDILPFIIYAPSYEKYIKCIEKFRENPIPLINYSVDAQVEYFTQIKRFID